MSAPVEIDPAFQALTCQCGKEFQVLMTTDEPLLDDQGQPVLEGSGDPTVHPVTAWDESGTHAAVVDHLPSCTYIAPPPEPEPAQTTVVILHDASGLAVGVQYPDGSVTLT